MVTAYILIQTEVGKASQVTDQIREIEGDDLVLDAHSAVALRHISAIANLSHRDRATDEQRRHARHHQIFEDHRQVMDAPTAALNIKSGTWPVFTKVKPASPFVDPPSSPV